MKITINGQPFEAANQATLVIVLEEFAAKEPYAVALNGDFIPRNNCSSTALKEGDSIELLSPIQGG
ncbi:sulfur carrier protein ThiS [Pseudoalteromonas shioyasakiensis]|uniref:sulfur carrier protein ThiS n=1 Tax=Pseudoalteromonas shioyasakiensis TaxID=1190813 RepID=UPI00211856EC|nr:sulfur carrier protein ThiS [Pseudoalteromonas shioyasakiensis]MCQ8879371.1 sulfur carrier protein ThiS [Pseudoalteromonas shioyasakiensis]